MRVLFLTEPARPGLQPEPILQSALTSCQNRVKSLPGRQVPPLAATRAVALPPQFRILEKS